MLRRLHLEYNFLIDLPREIFQLSSCRELHLDYNLLTTIPVEIEELTKLRNLSITGNCIEILPMSIANLNKMTALFMRDNLITWISPGIAKLKKLQSLNIDGNPLPMFLLEAHTLRDKKFILQEVLWRECWIAFLMGTHRRLGESSLIRKLPKDVIVRILCFVREEATKQQQRETKEKK